MKNLVYIVLPLLLFGFETLAQAEDLQTLDGEIYTNVRVREVKPNGLKIFHSKGIVFVHFQNLPDSVRRKYGYDPEKASMTDAETSVAQKKEATLRKIHSSKLSFTIRTIEQCHPIGIAFTEGFSTNRFQRLFGCYLSGTVTTTTQVEIPNSGTVLIQAKGHGTIKPIEVPVNDVRYFFLGLDELEKKWKWFDTRRGYKRSSFKYYDEPLIIQRHPEFEQRKKTTSYNRLYVVGKDLDQKLEPGMEVTLFQSGNCIPHNDMVAEIAYRNRLTNAEDIGKTKLTQKRLLPALEKRYAISAAEAYQLIQHTELLRGMIVHVPLFDDMNRLPDSSNDSENGTIWGRVQPCRRWTDSNPRTLPTESYEPSAESAYRRRARFSE